MIGFETLRERLLERVRRLVRNGETTERALARSAGLSQPHLHNILKGIRTLNADTGDQLMARLGMGVLDLVEADELRRALSTLVKNSEPNVEVPVLLDRLGPDLPWPERVSPFERVALPYRAVSRLKNPIVARLAEDPGMIPTVGAGDLVLLDDSPTSRCSFDPNELFAVEHCGKVAVRWIRKGRGRLYLVSAKARNDPARWEALRECPGASIIRARIIPLRTMYPAGFVYDPLLPPRDTHPAPVRP